MFNLLNNMKKLVFILILLGSVFIALYASATNNKLVVVYPKNGASINANSTFFVGNTNPNAKMSINGQPVKVYPNGAFVRVFSLKKGKNEIILVSKLNDDEKIIKYYLFVPTLAKKTNPAGNYFAEKSETVIVTETEAPLRKTPYGDRLTPVKKGMICQSVGVLNNHYKVKYGNGFAYILKNFVAVSDEISVQKQVAKHIAFHEDKKSMYISIPLEQAVLADVSNEKNILRVKLDNTYFDFQNINNNIGELAYFNFDENSLSIAVKSDIINGYDYYYEGNKFVLKIKKPFTNYIEGKTVVIDPGHGGKELGSVGPTEIPEKDVNLQISRYLKDELIKAGAHVYMTREKDEYVDLYDRVEYAKKKKADILISIHNNALPDGQNPYIKHGTETYYYQPQAIKLAQYVQKNLVNANGFNDLGIKQGSFVLTRPTIPVSILVEVGFMINPEEYSALLQSKNQQQYAIGIKNGIVEYFKNFS